jgi:Ca-activated chloride channel family protein
MEETTLVDFNRRAPTGQRLVAVYPADGTFFSDSPLITLDASWVTPAQKQAAGAFAAFAAKKITPAFAGRYGFRPASPSAKPEGLVSQAYGADTAQPARELKVPEPKVLAKIMSTWRADRKPGNVLLVLDNSGSMGDNDKIGQAKAGLQAFLREAGARDRVGLMKFSSSAEMLVPIGPMSANRARLLDAVAHINPESDTRLRDTTVDAVNLLQSHLDRNAINAVVLLTDGQDTVSGRTAQQVVAALAPQARKETGQIRVFTIAYGADANAGELAAYAGATGGKAFKAGTSDIEQVYRSISSFF